MRDLDSISERRRGRSPCLAARLLTATNASVFLVSACNACCKGWWGERLGLALA